MKHCRVFGSTARCVLSSVNHGLFPRSRIGQAIPGCSRAMTRKSPSGNTPAKSPGKNPVPRELVSGTVFEVSDTSPSPSVHPHSSTAADKRDVPMGEQLRAMMRLMAHSVIVVTSVHDDKPRGMTVSSFTSLSLDPPLVTFHVKAPSRTLDGVRQSRLLNLHVLAGNVHGAAHAHHFTTGNEAKNDTWIHGSLKLAGLRVKGWKPTAARESLVTTEPSVLTGAGVMYMLRCRLYEGEDGHGGIVMVRDHAIVIAEVLEVVEITPKNYHDVEQFGIVYADRHYRQLGKVFLRRSRAEKRGEAISRATVGVAEAKE